MSVPYFASNETAQAWLRSVRGELFGDDVSQNEYGQWRGLEVLDEFDTLTRRLRGRGAIPYTVAWEGACMLIRRGLDDLVPQRDS